MKIYNTKFNLKEERSAMDVAGIFRDWITERNYMDIPVYENSLDICIHNEQREYRTLFLQEERVLAGKFSMVAQGTAWITTFTFNDATKIFTVALDKKKGNTDAQFDEHFEIPSFINIMIEHAAPDAGLPISLEPLELNKSVANKVAQIITGEKALSLPLVLMSVKENGEMTADPGFIADDLKGTAHIVTSLSTKDDEYLAGLTNGLYKRNGIVSVYFAGDRNPVVFSQEDVSSEAFRHKIKNAILNGTGMECRNRLETWDGVFETHADFKTKSGEEQIKTLQEQVVKLKEENESWMQLIDKETEHSTQQIERLNQTCQKQEREVMILQAQLEAKRNQKKAILFAGDSEEFFPNEQREFVISAIQTAIKNTEATTRRMDVLQDIAEANKSDGILEERKAEVESIFNGKRVLGDKERRQLEDLGFAITHQSGHYKVTYHKDDRYVYTMGGTPSDVRAMKNNCHNIIKKVF